MDEVKETVKLIREFMKTDYIKNLKKTKTDFEYKEYFEAIFPIFQKKYPTLLYYILDGNDPIFLDRMIEGLNDIYNGKDKFEVEKEIGQDLADKYLPKKLFKKM
jgi:hypothetical protein